MTITELPQTATGQRANQAQATTEVTVVVPCFNETESMPFLAERLKEMQSLAPDTVQFRYILVDDGSGDSTWESMHEHFGLLPEFRFLRHTENRGIMAALKTGFNAVQTEWVASIDADCTFDPVALLDLIAKAGPETDVVVGSPYHPQGRVENVPGWRLLLSKGASFLYQRLMRNKLYCYTSCFRVYRTSALRQVEVKADGFVGMAEMLWRLDLAGARIVEVPSVLNVRKYGQSKMRTLKVIGEHVNLMRRIAFSN